MKQGDQIPLGNFQWRVLARHDHRALLITQDIVDLHWYHAQFVDVTWAGCALRHYLNHAFYQTFRAVEQARILPVTNPNPDNP